jgi:hypothetical protein
VLIGLGQEVRALATSDLPPAGSYLLPALMWTRAGCDTPVFDTYVGFANPGQDPVTVELDTSSEAAIDGVRVDTDHHSLPLRIEIPAASWLQLRLGLVAGAHLPCAGPGRFDLQVTTDGPLAFYASVVDRSDNDARTVEPIPLE